MIIDADPVFIELDTAGNSPFERSHTHAGTQFATVLAQCATTPLFAPWTVANQNAPANPAAGSAELNPHPAASNRREGRHARR